MRPEELRAAVESGALAALEGSAMLREAMADDVVDHCVNYGRTERRLLDQVVTCYERERLFERG